MLRKLAEATGGAAEFVTPGEALEAAARRMLVRMRQAPRRRPRVDWGADVVWQTPLPSAIFGGDTVLAFAGLAPGVKSRPRLLADDEHGHTVELARGESLESCTGETLARVAACRRMADASREQILQLALRYQLMSDQTHCILVHERAGDEKSDTQAQLQRVSSMLAAGWGGLGSVAECPPAGAAAFFRSTLPGSSADIKFSLCDDFAAPAFLRPQLDDDERSSVQVATLLDIANSVREHLAQGGAIEDLPWHCQGLALDARTQQAIDEVALLDAREGSAWLLLAIWVLQGQDGLAGVATDAVLHPHLELLNPALVSEAARLLMEILGTPAHDMRAGGRSQRLARAMNQQG